MVVESYLKPSLNYHILSLHTQNFTWLPLQPSCSDSSFSQWWSISGAHNDITAERKGKERATTVQKIKIWKRSHISFITILAHTHIASLADYSTGEVAKIIVKTRNSVRKG